MRFFKSSLMAVAALAGLVMAGENPIIFPDASSVIVAGTQFLITWTPTTGKTVDLALRQGPSGNLHDVETICTLNPNTGTYQWTPEKTLPAGTDYAIKITDDQGNINYTPLITIKSDVAPVSSSSSSASPSSTIKSSSTAKSSSSSSSHTTTDASSTITSSASASLSTSLTQAYANTTLITSSVGYANATSTGNLTRSATRSSTPTSSSESSTSTTASAISTGAASGLLKSPLALVVCVLGAVLYLN